MAVSFIGAGNRNTRWKPPTCRKSLTNYHTMLYRVHLAWVRFELITLVVIDTDCICSYKSNYHTTTMFNDKRTSSSSYILYVLSLISSPFDFYEGAMYAYLRWFLFSISTQICKMFAVERGSTVLWRSFHRQCSFLDIVSAVCPVSSEIYVIQWSIDPLISDE